MPLSRPEEQRNTLLSALGAGFARLGLPGLMNAWLVSQGYLQRTLPEKLAAWARASNIPQTKASYIIGTSEAGTPPGAPTIGTATAGNAQATVTFTAPGSSGSSPITGYRVTSSPGGITATGASSPITVTGLTNGVAYTFTVAAQNAVGYGPESSASASVTPTAATVPGAPTIGTATKTGDNQAQVTFTAPGSNGGSPITGYRVTASTGQTATGASSPITINNLVAGSSTTFTVAALNAIGYGAESGATAAIIVSGVGPELLGFSDGDFETGHAWVLTGSGSISGSNLNFVSYDTGTNYAALVVSPINTAQYRVVVNVSSFSTLGGGIGIKVGGGTLSSAITSTGQQTVTVTAGAGPNLLIQGATASGTTGTISQISLKRYFP